MADEKRYDETGKDLMSDFDESKFDRVGKPLQGVEQHDAGKPGDGNVEAQAAKHTLTDMSMDYEFFSTGPIHSSTMFDRDPVVEFNRQRPADNPGELPLAIDYSEPFFEGLGTQLVAGVPVKLDQRIYAIVRERWELCRDTIAGIAMMHRESGFYGRVHFYEIEIVDPFALKAMSVVTNLPMVTITVFGVSTNRSFSYLKPREYPRRPLLVNAPAKEEMQLESERVLGPPPSPETLLPEG